jgi:hypothetical protein
MIRFLLPALVVAAFLFIPSPHTTEAATCSGVLVLGAAPAHASPYPIVSVCVITTAGNLLYDKDTKATDCIAVKGIGTRVVTVSRRAPTCPAIFGALFGSAPPKATVGVSTSGRPSTGLLRFR